LTKFWAMLIKLIVSQPCVLVQYIAEMKKSPVVWHIADRHCCNSSRLRCHWSWVWELHVRLA